MSKERLSRLQKWILVRAYENKHEGEGSFGKWTSYKITKEKIYEKYFNLRVHSTDWARSRFGEGRMIRAFKFEDQMAGKKKTVILCRSLRALGKAGYVTSFWYDVRGPGGSFGTDLELTEKGIEKAKSIIDKTKLGDYTIRPDKT